MRHPLLLLPVLLLGACSFIQPYHITFTNTPGSVIDPASTTLDVVVNAPLLVYISGISCEGAEPLTLMPMVSKDIPSSTVHKLPLGLMVDQPSGADCEVTVTAYDQTTTEHVSSSISLKMPGATETVVESDQENDVGNDASTESATEVAEPIVEESTSTPEAAPETPTNAETASDSAE